MEPAHHLETKQRWNLSITHRFCTGDWFAKMSKVGKGQRQGWDFIGSHEYMETRLTSELINWHDYEWAMKLTCPEHQLALMVD